MFRPHLQASLWCFLPGIFGLVAPNSTKEHRGQSEGLLAHTIDNNNPYNGIPPVKPRQGRQSVIFEPLQNVQVSRSEFQVTSFIDFQTYLDYFHNYEGYLEKFMDSVLKVPKQPLYQRFMRDKGGQDVSTCPGTSTNHLGAGTPQKPTTTHLTLKEGHIRSEKIMSICVRTHIYMHVWYSASLIGY